MDVLGFPNFKKAFILATDTSTTGLGACLSQEVNSVLKPVGYAGRGLTSAERNYTTTKQECLAVVWVTRWVTFLNQFTYTDKHVQGTKNVVPHALSQT